MPSNRRPRPTPMPIANTVIDERKASKLLKARYKRINPNDLTNYFKDELIIPNLFSLYEQFGNLSGTVPYSFEDVTTFLFTRNGPSILDEEFVLNNVHPIMLPDYIRDSLKLISNIAEDMFTKKEKSKYNKYSFDSISRLNVILDKDENTRYSFSSNKLMLAMIWGAFTPDDNLQNYVFNSITKKKPELAALLKSGTICYKTIHAKSISMSSLRYSSNLMPLMNIAVSNLLMNKLIDKYHTDSSLESLSISLYNDSLHGYDSNGAVINLAKSGSQVNLLIVNKLHMQMFSSFLTM